MIPPELLTMVRCPATGQTLSPCLAETVSALNKRILSGVGPANVGGQAVSEPLTDGLIRADGALLYPVRDGIPVLLADEGISLSAP